MESFRLANIIRYFFKEIEFDSWVFFLHLTFTIRTKLYKLVRMKKFVKTLATYRVMLIIIYVLNAHREQFQRKCKRIFYDFEKNNVWNSNLLF